MTIRSVMASALSIAAFAFNAHAASAATCESLRQLSLPNVTITTTTSVAAGPFQAPGTPAPPPVMLPAHCRIAAVLTPSSDSHIEIEIWMPTENWNGKFEAVGNGGWAGNITYGSGTPQAIPRNMAFALSEGYAAASTDTGHVNDGTQALFAAGHPEKMIDFAYRAVHEMTVVSKAVISAFYGNGPKLSYWNGCSTGGRQALMEAQRFPDDFDGIVAGAPANFMTHLPAGHLVAAQATHQGEPGNMSVDKLRLLHDAVMRACDGRDGVRDGVLENPTRCSIDLKQLACRSADSTRCLTDAQIAAAQTMYAGAVNPHTKELVFPGMALGSELGWDPMNGLVSLPISNSYFKDVVFQDSTWDYHRFRVDSDIAKADAVHGTVLNAVDPNLRAFFARGGKLIQYHGWNDQQISPFNSINYFKSVEATLGHDVVSDSYRLFMVPGMMHCGGGEGPNQFNAMSTLERWREQNIAPTEIVAAHVTNGVVDNTRPLCPYPQIAVYSGHGSAKDAANFSCKTP
jgi:tannase/feruloyl esterase